MENFTIIFTAPIIQVVKLAEFADAKRIKQMIWEQESGSAIIV